MKSAPAVDVHGVADPDVILAIVDDFGPTALEEHPAHVRIFFAASHARDAARAALTTAHYVADVVDVSDEDWARRSQQNITAVTVGRVTVAPPWTLATSRQSLAARDPQSLAPDPQSLASSPQPLASSLQPVVVVIEPSMAFGTGHHATTRLCLAALQTIDLTDRFVLDVGTGSGILALAATRLGAARALGLDSDPDAIQAASENLARNHGLENVAFNVVDLTSACLPQADVVTANLTGALLVRTASTLLDGVLPGGTLIVSGLLVEERAAVRSAFGRAELIWEDEEDGWVVLNLRRVNQV